MSTSFRTDSSGNSGAISFKGIDNVKLVTTGPELLGTPRAPTPSSGNNSTQVATTAFVADAVAGITTNNPTPSNIVPLMDAVNAVIGASVMYARGDHVHPQFTSPATVTPAPVAVSGSAGVASDYARGDHVHPAPPQSLGASGYISLPGGFVMQWGFNTFANAGSTVLFPITFPNSIFAVMATPASSSGNETCAVSNQANHGFTGRSTNGVGCFWMALGR